MVLQITTQLIVLYFNFTKFAWNSPDIHLKRISCEIFVCFVWQILNIMWFLKDEKFTSPAFFYELKYSLENDISLPFLSWLFIHVNIQSYDQ